MPFIQNDNIPCTVCTNIYSFTYQVPGACGETGPGGGMPICTDCFYTHIETRLQNGLNVTCPCCGRDMSNDMAQAADEFTNPNQYGLPEGVRQADIAPNLNAIANALPEIEQAEEEQQQEEEQEERQEEEEREHEQEEHEHPMLRVSTLLTGALNPSPE